jgi:hypothetical protein
MFGKGDGLQNIRKRREGGGGGGVGWGGEKRRSFSFLPEYTQRRQEHLTWDMGRLSQRRGMVS